MTLLDVIARLHEFDDELTIYAERDPEWTQSSRAVVALEPEHDGLASVLQVAVAKEAVRTWSTWRKNRLPSLRERYEAVLYYALNDAFLPPELDDPPRE
jgi:hypothetical protein